MNKTLKTYPDGSEMTVTGLATAILLCTACAAVGSVAVVKISNWRTDRWLKKTGNYHATK